MSVPDEPLHPVDFSTHVLSLASYAMVALGQMPSPSGEAVEIDLDTARYLVDVHSHTQVSGMPFKAEQLAAVLKEEIHAA